jgi:hypothetical protein
LRPSQAEDVIDGVGVGAFVGFDAVDGDVDGAGAGAVDADGAAGALDDAGFVDEEIEGVAAVEREGFDGLAFDDVADGGAGGLEDFGGGFYLDGFGSGTDFEGGVDGGGGIDLEDDFGELEFLEAGFFDNQAVGADGDGGEGEQAGVGGGEGVFEAGGFVGGDDGGAGDDCAARI